MEFHVFACPGFLGLGRSPKKGGVSWHVMACHGMSCQLVSSGREAFSGSPKTWRRNSCSWKSRSKRLRVLHRQKNVSPAVWMKDREIFSLTLSCTLRMLLQHLSTYLALFMVVTCGDHCTSKIQRGRNQVLGAKSCKTKLYQLCLTLVLLRSGGKNCRQSGHRMTSPGCDGSPDICGTCRTAALRSATNCHKMPCRKGSRPFNILRPFMKALASWCKVMPGGTRCRSRMV